MVLLQSALTDADAAADAASSKYAASPSAKQAVSARNAQVKAGRPAAPRLHSTHPSAASVLPLCRSATKRASATPPRKRASATPPRSTFSRPFASSSMVKPSPGSIHGGAMYPPRTKSPACRKSPAPARTQSPARFARASSPSRAALQRKIEHRSPFRTLADRTEQQAGHGKSALDEFSQQAHALSAPAVSLSQANTQASSARRYCSNQLAYN